MNVDEWTTLLNADEFFQFKKKMDDFIREQTELNREFQEVLNKHRFELYGVSQIDAEKCKHCGAETQFCDSGFISYRASDSGESIKEFTCASCATENPAHGLMDMIKA